MNRIATTDQGGIRLENVAKKFGNTMAVDSVSFHVRHGEFMSLLGPSGCGKTTALRIIAGFVKPTTGTVKVGGVDITHLPPFKRNIGLVFQNYALWTHMTVFENIAFGLKLRKFSSREIKQKVDDVISLTNLHGLEKRFPRELSGGQQQRVAVARVLALNPAVFLLDEPLSNLDRKLRIHMRQELRQLQERLGITTLFVTHDQNEALSMSDRVAIMNKGKIIQIGTPNEIYEKPRSMFVADFVGNTNSIEGDIVDVSEALATLKVKEGFSLKVRAEGEIKTGERLSITIRPERLKISPEPMQGDNVLPGSVKYVDYFGSSIRYHVALETGYLVVVEDQNIDKRMRAAERVYVKIDARHCYAIKPEV